MSVLTHIVDRSLPVPRRAAATASTALARGRVRGRRTGSLRIGLVGGPRFGVEEPLAGGMEAMLRSLAAGLAGRGHDVEVFAGTGPLPAEREGFRCRPLLPRRFEPSPIARADVSMPPERFMEEHHAFLTLGRRLADGGHDVIHNHSLHYLPPLYETKAPILHTLHSPPTPWLESAYGQPRPGRHRVVSVSEANARSWGFPVEVVHNGVTVPPDPAAAVGDHAVWTGRIVPEKGTHLALDAARRCGRPIKVAGPVHDTSYFEREVRPRLGPDATYVGHLRRSELTDLVAGAAVALVTPEWDEPFGLVVAEALALGTPVAAFARGGIPELLTDEVGRLAPAGDVDALAGAAEEASTLDRSACRRHVEEHFSVDAMIDRYEALYRAMAAGRRR